jgi:hypothetical protein
MIHARVRDRVNQLKARSFQAHRDLLGVEIRQSPAPIDQPEIAVVFALNDLAGWARKRPQCWLRNLTAARTRGGPDTQAVPACR